jgi:hypothetical protein
VRLRRRGPSREYCARTISVAELSLGRTGQHDSALAAPPVPRLAFAGVALQNCSGTAEESLSRVGLCDGDEVADGRYPRNSSQAMHPAQTRTRP